MYSKIMIPLDGSRLSERILPYARTFAEGLEIPVELLCVIEPDTISTFTDPKHGRYVDTVEVDMKQQSIDYLKQMAHLFPDSCTVSCRAEIGNPAEIIVTRAAVQDSTLIAMSTHGRSGVQRWLLGSVADKVLHGASNHLLLVRPKDEGEGDQAVALKTVLIPLDGSHLAELALQPALEVAKKINLEAVLLQVYDPLAHGGYLPYITDEITASVKKGAEEYLEEKAHQWHEIGLERVSFRSLQGNTAAEIIDFAKGTPSSLVAMCTHGRSGIGRWLLGSVTDRVVRYSGDPVLVVRATNQT